MTTVFEEESVHGRWHTGYPSDWMGVRSLEDVQRTLRSTYEHRVAHGRMGPLPDTQLDDDARLIWAWLRNSREAQS